MPVAEPAILCIETSTACASLAVFCAGRVLFEASFTSDRSHNAGLFAPLQEALATLPEGRRLDCVVAGTGPGSYSGTRVGIAAAQGVAMVHGCPAVGLSSLAAVPVAAAAERAMAIGDARRGSAWHCLLEKGTATAIPQLLPAAGLLPVVEECWQQGIPVFSLEPAERTGLPQASAALVTMEVPSATLLGQAWLALSAGQREALESEPLQPVYLQPPHITEAKKGHPLVTAARRI